ncbi:hypothetical protein ACGTI2_18655 [Morganella morganii]|nr:hypothetical protein [Morganella morganii]QXO53576.1 hypothetical protein JC830_18255 [Morganella morganii]QXO61235.1 hypothetical protein JC826_17570 [Morganella morganii]HAE78534.1 hypothetical protein [Morganella sp. (in: enterobacteria)]
MNITGNSSTQTAGYIPENDVIQKKTVLPDNTVNQEIVRLVAENQYSQKNAVTGKTAEEIIRPFSHHVIPSLLSDYDNKRMSAVIELCNVLLLDAVNQQERRDTLEKLAMKQATQLKELKYQEADYQIAAAVTGAVIAVTVAVTGASMAITAINPANPAVLTARGIAGQAISGLSQTLGQLGSQPLMAMGTRTQGDGEVVRALKDILISTMSVHNKVSDDQKALQKKLLEMLISEFENRKNTTQNLINNMKG